MNPMPILATDVQYANNSTAQAAGLIFDEWAAEAAASEVVVPVNGILDYEPGEFFRRELPCLLKIIEAIQRPIDLIVVDGYVWLDEGRPGLGAKLFEEINQTIPVIGVAKTRFRNASATEILRGTSNSPLFITSVGIEWSAAARHIQSMHGPHRIPTLLRRVDQLCRGLAE